MLANDNHVVDRRILQQADALVVEGHQVEVICGFEVAADTRETHGNVTVHRFSKLPISTHLAKFLERNRGLVPRFVQKFLVRIEQILIRLSGRSTEFERQVLRRVEGFNFDVLHVHDMPLLRVGSQIADGRGVKLVYDAHELYFAQRSVPWLTRFRMKREEAKFIHRPDLVFTVNRFVADEMRRLYGRSDIKVLLNSAPTVRDRNSTSPTLRELVGISPMETVVLYQGWISPERGLEHLIRAAVFFQGRATLVIIGYGEFVQKLQKLVQTLDLQGSVRFLGRMNYEELQRITHQADLGVIPYVACDFNTTYCSPNKFFEYIASGVPIIANDLPFLREKIEEFGCGAVANIEDSEKFSAVTLSLLESPLAKPNCLRAQEEMGWETERGKLIEWYKNLVWNQKK